MFRTLARFAVVGAVLAISQNARAQHRAVGIERKLAYEEARLQGTLDILELKQRVRDAKKQDGKYNPEQAARIAKARAAKPLAPLSAASQVRCLSAKQLLWPGLLLGPEFERERLAIDELMARRSYTPIGDAHQHFQITQQVDGHAAAIRRKLEPFAAQARASYYVQARTFLNGLHREFDAPPSSAGFVDATAPIGIAAR